MASNLEEIGAIYDIVLDENPKGFYYPEDVVAGVAKLETNNMTLIKGVSLLAFGIKEINYDVRNVHKSHENRPPELYYTEELFKYDIKTVEAADKGDYVLPIATYEYPFRFTLPKDIPSSFSGIYGSIKYYLTTVFHRDWEDPEKDTKFQYDFSVHRKVNMNDFKENKNPIDIEDEIHFGCLCCRSGPVDVKIHCPRQGYLSGQTINVNIFVTNDSSFDLSNVHVALIQCVLYKAYENVIRDHRKTDHEIVKQELGTISKLSKKELKITLEIPDGLQPTAPESDPIEIIYELVIKVETPKFHKDLEYKSPIIIGNYSLSAKENEDVAKDTTLTNDTGSKDTDAKN